MTIAIIAQAGYLGNPTRSLVTVTGSSYDPGAMYRVQRTTTPYPSTGALSQSLTSVRFVIDGDHGSTYKLLVSKDQGATYSDSVAGAVRTFTVPAAPAERILTADWGALYPDEPGYSEAHLSLTGLQTDGDYLLYLQSSSAQAAGAGTVRAQWRQSSSAEGRRYMRIIMGEQDMGYARFTLHRRNNTTGDYDYLNVDALLLPYVEARRFCVSPLDIVVYASHLRPGTAHTLRYGSVDPAVGPLFPALTLSVENVTPSGSEYRWESAASLLGAIAPPFGPVTLDAAHRTAWAVGIGTSSSIAYLAPGVSTPAGSIDSTTGLSVRAAPDTAGLHVAITVVGVGAANWWWIVRRTATARRVIHIGEGPPPAPVQDVTAPMDVPISYEVWEFATTRPTEASVPSKIKASNVVLLPSGVTPAFSTDSGRWAVLRSADGSITLRAGLADVAWTHQQRTQILPIAGAHYPAVAADVPLAPSGDLLLITPDLESRAAMLRLLESGQVLYLRAPCVPGVDSLWIRVVGQVDEKPAERSVPAARAWQLPIQTLAEPELIPQPFGALQ